MVKVNTARDIMWPSDSDVLVRAVFLYVGQGSSTVVLVADGESYKALLVDINLDVERGGIDVPRLVKDLLGDDELYAFVNTHPHDDHLRGITELSKGVGITQVWHSGHVPGKKYGASYEEMKQVIDKVKRVAAVNEVVLRGSQEAVDLGDASYHVLAPAEYVADEVDEAKAEERYQRIHEQCAVLKFGVGDSWIMIPGDADRNAFEKYIAQYHKERLGAVVLAAPHHGSRTFFRYKEEDSPYTDALDGIDPDYAIISAPTSDESPHDHPHDDAVSFYEEKVGKDNVLHTGESRYCFICDIYRDGTYSGLEDDKGELAEAYALGKDTGDESDSSGANAALAGLSFRPRSTVDDRPMGGQV